MIRWGILGAGNIAHRFAKSLTMNEDCQLWAISCRKEEKGRAFNQEYPSRKQYYGENCYMEMLEDPDIDVVYICVPHGLHHYWSKEALKKGKAVLCEKPAMVTAQEMQDIIDTTKANDTLFVEAMKSRFLPAYRKVREMVARGEIGEITKIETDQCRPGTSTGAGASAGTSASTGAGASEKSIKPSSSPSCNSTSANFS